MDFQHIWIIKKLQLYANYNYSVFTCIKPPEIQPRSFQRQALVDLEEVLPMDFRLPLLRFILRAWALDMEKSHET